MDAGSADQQNKTPTPEPVPAGPADIMVPAAAELLDRLAAMDREIDEDDIDLFLDQQDPHFKLAMDTIGQDTELTAMDVETDDAAQAYYEELEFWKNSSGILRLIFRVFPLAPRVSLAAKIYFFKTKRWVISNWIRFKNWLNDFARRSARKIVAGAKAKRQEISEGSKKWLREYKYMSWRVKIQLYLTLILGGSAFYGFYKFYKGDLIPPDSDLFIASLEDVSTGTYHYNPDDAQEQFYNNIRSVPNLFLIPKIFTNIRASSMSGPTPMLAVEFFAEGFNPEVIIEMKDREPAIRDLAQRSIEEFTFDELDTTVGKQKMTMVLMRELNRVLTTGQVKAIRIKTLILKP